MNDDATQDRMDVSEIGQQLKEGRLSRSSLFDRLKALGIGFGAAFVLGITGAHAASAPEASVAVKSSNPAINAIIQGGPQQGPTASVDNPLQKVAYYHRFFRRYFSRFYRRY